MSIFFIAFPAQAQAKTEGSLINDFGYDDDDIAQETKGILASLKEAVAAMREFISIITSPKRIAELLMFIIASIIGFFLDIILFVFTGIFTRNFLLTEGIRQTAWAVTIWSYLWFLSLAFFGIALLYLASRFIQGKPVPAETIRAFLLALFLNFTSLWLTEYLILLLNQASWTVIDPVVIEVGAAFGETDLTPPFSHNLILKAFIGDIGGGGGEGLLSQSLLKGDWVNLLPMIITMTALIALGFFALLRFVTTRCLLIASPYYLVRIGFLNNSLETLAGFLNLYARTYSLQIIFNLTWLISYRINRSLATTGTEQTGGLGPDIMTGIVLWAAVFVVYKFWFVHAKESTKHLVTHLGGEQVIKNMQTRYNRGLDLIKGLPSAGAGYVIGKGGQAAQMGKESIQKHLDEQRMDELYHTGRVRRTPFSEITLSNEIRERFNPELRQSRENQTKYWEYSDRLVSGYIYYDEDGNAVIFDEPPKDGINMGSWNNRKGKLV